MIKENKEGKIFPLKSEWARKGNSGRDECGQKKLRAIQDWMGPRQRTELSQGGLKLTGLINIKDLILGPVCHIKVKSSVSSQ